MLPNRAARCQDSAGLRPVESPSYPRVSALSHFQSVPGCVFAFTLMVMHAGFEPATSRLQNDCSTTELKHNSHCDAHTPVVSLPFERRNATRRMSFVCRLLDRNTGRWLLARTPNFCTGALARKARTVLHYSLPLTVNDVGVAGCSTTCSLM